MDLLLLAKAPARERKEWRQFADAVGSIVEAGLVSLGCELWRERVSFGVGSRGHAIATT